MTDQPSRGQLRQVLRQARRNLTCDQHHAASQAILKQLCGQGEFITAKRIAAYLANDGEPDLTPVIDFCLHADTAVSLPVLHPLTKKHLLFLDYTATTPMRLNRFNISEPEPACQSIRLLGEHDVILMPLVGFDAQGNRLGMGGGFYDRTLAYQSNTTKGPLLIGVAHSCQQVEQLPVAPWDVPCDMIVTPDNIWRYE